MPAAKKIMLESRLQKRLRILDHKDYRSYLDYVFSVEGRKGELIEMIDAVTTNKTDFFREADHFDLLVRQILPELKAAKPASKPLLFWSAGCSTGEEPYTLAMVLSEFMDSGQSGTFKIITSDISTKVLDKAEAGIYEEEKASVVPMEYKKKYMLKSKMKDACLVKMKREIRNKIEFVRINLMDDSFPVPHDLDVIFCRNVIIYFDRATQKRILSRMCLYLKKKGYLILGHSETLAGMDMPLENVAPTVYQRIY
jgi:chemotaxis protein methyltransferase CheR